MLVKTRVILYAIYKTWTLTRDDHYLLNYLLRVNVATEAACWMATGWLDYKTVEIAVSYSVYGLQYNWWLFQGVCKPLLTLKLN